MLMSAPMVRAILAGTKTQTRREFKTRNGGLWPNLNDRPGMRQLLRECRHGQPGDRLWVRESWAAPHKFDAHRPADIPALTRWHYAATEELGGLRGRPSIHMPRCASRITLDVTGVRLERLQDISEADALAEGIVATRGGFGLPDGSHYHATDPRISYWSLWEHINGAGSVESNPFVWVVEFRRVTP
jgi:hypothetical protein